MKITVEEDEGVTGGKAIAVESTNASPDARITVTIWNDEQQSSIELTAERARQVAMALIAASGGGGDAG